MKEVLFDLRGLEKTLLVAVIELEELHERLVIELELLEAVGCVTPLNFVGRVLDLVAELVNQCLDLLIRLDVLDQILSDVFKLILAEIAELLAQAGDCLGEEVVDHMGTLGVQLMQEEFDLVLDTVVRVLKHHTDVDYLTLEFQHVVKNQVSDDHQSLLANVHFLVMQEHENVLDSLIHEIWESVEQISKSDDDVGLYSELDV